MAWKKFSDGWPPEGRQYLAGCPVTNVATNEIEWAVEICDENDSPDESYYLFWLLLPKPKKSMQETRAE